MLEPIGMLRAATTQRDHAVRLLEVRGALAVKNIKGNIRPVSGGALIALYATRAQSTGSVRREPELGVAGFTIARYMAIPETRPARGCCNTLVAAMKMSP